MINLFSKTASQFNTNGEATLMPIECFFSCAINGVWQLEMTLPYDAEERYKLIDYDKILKVSGIEAVVEQTSSYQLFRIYDYRKGDDNVYILAYPIGLDARYDTYGSITAYDKTPAQAISQINGVSQKYTVSTDITDTNTYSMAWADTNIIAMLNGDDSFVNTFGGEIVYDNYNIKVNDSLGRDTGAPEVRYGKNIMGMEIEYDISNVITRLYPIAKSGEVLNAIAEYQQGAYPYVDADNAGDYPVPHISSVTTPFTITQLTDDGSDTYRKSRDMYELVRDYTALWLYRMLTGVNTGLFDAWLAGQELKCLIDNYAFTMINDGTEGILEYLWRKVYNATGYVIRSGDVKSLIYNAMKEGFENVLKNDSSATYVGSATKQLKSIPGNKYIYTYSWDTNGSFRTKPHAGESYAWVYANSKWNQLNQNGETTGTTDSATWKWYKVSGKSWKRYGNKKKKRYLQGQWWEISGVWYWFDNDGHGISGSELMTELKGEFEYWTVNNKTLVETLAPSCKSYESQLFGILYGNMIDYCNMLFVEDGLSYPTPKINIDVVDLSKTTEYADYSGMLTIKLGDTVKCTNTKLGMTTDLRVTGVTFDVLRGYNSQLTIGLTENSVVQLLDAIGKDASTFHGYTAGEGILINGQTISAIPQEGKIKDVTINGQSVVFGGKANIDLDAINGEGLQWFEETENSLFGASDTVRMVDDEDYRISSAEMHVTNDSHVVNLRVEFAVTNGEVVAYCPWKNNYQFKIVNAQYASHGVLFMSRNKPTVVCSFASYDFGSTPVTGSKTVDYDSYSTETDTNVNIPQSDRPDYQWELLKVIKSSITENGETWYGMYIHRQTDWYGTMGSATPSIEAYLPASQFPDHEGIVGYQNLAEFMSTVLTLEKEATGNNFNGLSREGNLAFYAGASDEHGTDAPIKIYNNGTYDGFDMVGATSSADGKKGVVPQPLIADKDKFLRGDGTWQTAGGVEDVKSDNVSVVTNNIAHINTMVGATSSANGTKGLVPAPLKADREKFLRGDKTWATPTDTTYNVFDNNTDGLVPAPENDTGYLKSDGTWDEPQDTTYSVFDTTTDGLVPAPQNSTGYLKSDGSWGNPPGTTYSDFSGSAHGLVPASNSGSQGKYLKGDGSWDTPQDTTYSDFAGSSHGLVPASDSGSQTKYLKGDGSWGTPDNTTYNDFNGTTHGLVPVATGSGSGRFLKEDGSWGLPPAYSDFSGSTHGLVPASNSSSQSKYLKGDGSWGTPQDTTYNDFDGSAHGLVPAPGGNSGYLKSDGSWGNPPGGTDENVKQSPATDNSNFEVLLSGTADNTEHTEGAKKSNKLSFNPNQELFKLESSANFYTRMTPGTVRIQQNASSANTPKVEVVGYDESLTVGKNDIALTGSTWDSTNTSLKSALSGRVSKSGDTMTGTLVTPADNSKGLEPATNNYGQIGSATKQYNVMRSYNFVSFGGEFSAFDSNKVKHLDVSDSDITFNTSTTSATADTWDGTNTSLKSAISAITTALGKIKSGTVSGSVSVGSGSYADKAITFGVTFSSAPRVFVQLTGDAANNSYRGQMQVFVTSTSTTGANVRIYNASAATISVGLSWLAVGL